MAISRLSKSSFNFFQKGNVLKDTSSLSNPIEVLIVGGGGGGAHSAGGGGGGGGVVWLTGYEINLDQQYSITIGAGGAGHTTGYPRFTGDGGDSSFNSIIAYGGGYGQGYTGNASSKATGGGSGGSGTGLAGTSIYPSQGFKGGSGGGVGGGGGGGAGAPGGTNSDSVGMTHQGQFGGDGINFYGTYYGGGGGGGGFTDATNAAKGGLGGGGNGGKSSDPGAPNPAATNGADGFGGGGGGGGGSDAGANGGTGAVVIRYPDSQRAAIATTGSPTISVANGFRTYKFIFDGSITF